MEFLEQEAERSTEAHEAEKALLERQAEMQRQSYESQLKRVGRAGGVCWAWGALVCGTRGTGKRVVAYGGTSSIFQEGRPQVFLALALVGLEAGPWAARARCPATARAAWGQSCSVPDVRRAPGALQVRGELADTQEALRLARVAIEERDFLIATQQQCEAALAGGCGVHVSAGGRANRWASVESNTQ